MFVPGAWWEGSTGTHSGRRGGWSGQPCWWRWRCTAWGGRCPPDAAAMPRWRRSGTASSRRPTGTHWACPGTFPPATWSKAPYGGCPNQTAPYLQEWTWRVMSPQSFKESIQTLDDYLTICFTLRLVEKGKLCINGGSWEGGQTKEVLLQQGDVGLLVHSWNVLSEGDEEKDTSNLL